MIQTAPDQTGPPPPEPPQPTGGQPLTRLTVNLTKRSVDALEATAARTGLGKTDVVNRALQIYQLVEQLMDLGGGHLTVTHQDGQVERIYIV